MSIFNLNTSTATELGTAVRARSWDWLFTLQLRLGVDLHLVDRYGTTVLSSILGGPNAVEIGPLLASENAARTAVLTAARTVVPQSITAGAALLACLPVTSPRTDIGVLVVARRAAPDGVPDPRTMSELERVGEWLCTAVQAHLGSAVAEDAHHQVAALMEVLHASDGPRSDRQAILTWIEAMSIWHDLEVHAYVDDLHEHFIHDAALPGANTGDVPTLIPAASVEHAGQPLMPLPPDEAEQLGFAKPKDVVICKLGSPARWMLAVCGSMGMHDGATLRAYVRVLEDALSLATLTVQARCIESMTAQLFADDTAIQHHAEQALKTLQDTLGLSVVSLTIRSAGGAPLIVVGDWQRSAANVSDARARMVVLRHKENQYSLALGVVKGQDQRVTPLDARVVEKAAGLLELWAQRMLSRKETLERRAVPRRFDMFVEELAAQAAERNVPVAGMVIELRPAAFASTVASECVAQLRHRMRASDLVGLLSETNIGLLLHNTPAEDLPVVENRVRRIMQEVGAGLGGGGVAIGLAARTPGERSAVPILAEARAQLAHKVVASEKPWG